MGDWAWGWARARAQWPMTWVPCPMALSYVLWPCPMALSYPRWPCPMSYGPVLCPMILTGFGFGYSQFRIT